MRFQNKIKRQYRERLIIVMVVIFLIISGGFAKQVYAQVNVIDEGLQRLLEKQTETDTGRTGDTIADQIARYAKKEGLAEAFKSALGIFLNQLSHDTAVWVASGANGQKPFFFTKGWGPYLRDLGDQALGEFVYEAGRVLDTKFHQLVLDQQVRGLIGNDEAYKEYISLKNAAVERCGSSYDTAQARSECINESINSVTTDYLIFESDNDEYFQQYQDCMNSFSGTGDIAVDKFDAREEACKRAALPSNVIKGGGADAAELLSPRTGVSVLGSIASGIAKNLCAPSSPDVALRITLGVKYKEQRAKCTFSQIRDQFETAVLDPNFTVKFSSYFQSNQNDIGIALNVWDNALQEVANKEILGRLERLAGANTKAKKEPVSGNIKTPPKIIEKLVESGLTKISYLKESTYTGTIADAIATFITTLTGQLLEQIGKKGLVQSFPKDSTSFPDSRFGSESLTNFTGSPGSAGIAGAKLQFANIKNIDFSGAGAYSIINQLTQCPDPRNPGPTECVITGNFRDAVIAGKTVREAMESGNLDGDLPLGFTGEGVEPPFNEGYPYRSLIILRKYRIIPVGWELAALYIKHFGKETTPLRTVVLNYDNPGSAFYRLINPNWVLKSPENFCTAEGPGPVITAERILDGRDVNNDGDFLDEGDTPPSIALSRNSNYCANEKSCLATNPDGSCKFFGYCTQDKPIWNFDGNQCDSVFNTCTAFQDSDGATVSYLRNTLEFNGCSADNAGCQWYCEDRNPRTGEWVCSETAGNKIFFDRDAKSCSENGGGCRKYYPIKEGNGVNLIANSSLEDFNGKTGDVAADSFLQPSGSIEGHSAVNDAFIGVTAAQLAPGVDFTVTADTGLPVRGRTFAFSFFAKGCSDSATFGFAGAPSPGTISGNSGDDEWQRFSVTYTYPVTSPQTSVGIFINDSGAACKIDGLMLEEGNASSPYRNYTENPAVFLKTAPPSFDCRTDNPSRHSACDRYTLSCTSEEVGCAFYTPITKSGTAIPAVTREGDFCAPECVGYSTFKQEPTFFESGSFPHYFIPGTANQCSAAQAGCDEFTNLDKVARGGEGREYYQYLRQCVGPNDSGASCGTFFSWVGSEETGYQLKTYSLVKDGDAPAVSSLNIPSDLGSCSGADDAINNPECRQYYNESGAVSYRYFRLTTSCGTSECFPYRKTDSTEIDCANSGGSWQDGYCLYYAVPGASIQCSSGAAGCRAYSGNAASNVREVFADGFEDGDTQGWDASAGFISSESVSPAGHSIVSDPNKNGTANVIRTNSGLVTFIPGRTYEVSFWAKAAKELTTLTLSASGGSPFVFAAAGADSVPISTQWNAYTIGPFTYSSDATANVASLQMVLTAGSGQRFFLDNIRVTEVQDSMYVIKNSWNTPLACDNLPNDPYGFACGGTPSRPLRCSGPGAVVSSTGSAPSETPYALGCAAYNGPDGEVTLSSFTNICREEAVGCTAMIDTANSSLPYEKYSNAVCTRSGAGPCTIPGSASPVCVADASGQCQFDFIGSGSIAPSANTVITPADSVRYIVNNPAKQCSENEMGCRALGNPNISEQFNPNIRIKQGNTTYYAGIFTDTRPSGEVYYNGATPLGFSNIGTLNGIQIERGGESNLFVYKNDDAPAGDPEMSLFIVHGKERSGTAGGVSFSFSGYPNGTTVAVSDDETPRNELTLPNAKWDWVTRAGDGGVIDFPASDSDSWPITITPSNWTQYCVKDTTFVGSKQACTDNTECSGAVTRNYCLLDTLRECPTGVSVGEDCDGGSNNPCMAGTAAPICGSLTWGFLSSNGQRIELDMNSPVTIEYSRAGFTDTGFRYTTDYLLDRPDDYDTILCQEENLWCEEFAGPSGFSYFKDPRENVCEYRTPTNQQGGAKKWFKKKQSPSDPDIECITTDQKTLGINGVPVETPAGVCRGGTDGGKVCLSDSGCSSGECVQFAGTCPVSESTCREYVDPLSSFAPNRIFNGDFEQDIDNNKQPDGWSGKGSYTPQGKEIVADITDITSDKLFSQELTLDPNTVYTIAGDIRRAPTETGDAIIGVIGTNLGSPDGSMVQNSVDGTIELRIAQATLKDNHQRFSGRFETGSESSYTVFLGVRGGIGKGHVFDNISLTQTGIYYNLENSIDKSSCSGTVNHEAGCVLMNERNVVGDGLAFAPLSYDADMSGGDRFQTASTNCENEANPSLCDSNALVKVRPDRECAEWLTCRSSVEEVLETGEVRQQCLDLALCRSIDEATGACSQIIARTSELANTNLTLGKDGTPYNIDLASYLSGYTKAGAVYHSAKGTNTIEGYLPFDQMVQTGQLGTLENGNFEQYSASGQPVGWAVQSGAWSPDQFRVIADPFTVQTELGAATRRAPEGKAFLRVGSTFTATSELIEVAGGNPYIISAFINTANLDAGNADVRIEEYDSTGAKVGVKFADSASTNGLPFLEAGSGWQFKVGRFNTSPTTARIRVRLMASAGAGAIGSFYYDDIAIRSALTVQKQVAGGAEKAAYCGTGIKNGECYVPRDCRLYPENDAFSCEYFDNNGLLIKGWPGYCLEYDPNNSSICLEWWPVDKIAGDALDEQGTTYSDRTPLYMCLNTDPSENSLTLTGPERNPAVPDACWILGRQNADIEIYEPEGEEIYVTPNNIKAVRYKATKRSSLWSDPSGTLEDKGRHCIVRKSGSKPAGGRMDVRSFSAADSCVQDSDCNIAENEKCAKIYYDSYKDPGEQIFSELLAAFPTDSLSWWTETYFIDESGDCAMFTANEGVKFIYDINDPSGSTCTEIAQVVTPSGQNTAWTGRISQGSSYTIPGLNISLRSDYQPFGGVVPPEPVGIPEEWDGKKSVCVDPGLPELNISNIECTNSSDCLKHAQEPYTECHFLDNDPLSVETPIKTGEFTNPPYQVRAGTPYACSGGADCPIGKCLNTLEVCTSDRECGDGSICCTPKRGGKCDSEPAPLRYDSSITVDDAKALVQRIFARSYGTWRWNSIAKQYVSSDNNWTPPSSLCAGNLRSGNNLCGVAPVISELTVPSLQDSLYIDNTGFVTLTFNSTVDFNQSPIRRIKIDWGDGKVSVLSGVRMKAKSNPDEPHRFFHLYSYWDLKGKNDELDSVTCGTSPDGTYRYCTVDVKVQVQDNWGWCNAGGGALGYVESACDTNADAWSTPITIEVRQ